MAPASQIFWHSAQPIQPARQFALTTRPLSMEWHKTRTFALSGTISINFFGQTATHFPQAVHFFVSTRAMLSTIFIALNGQAFLQLASPIQL
jgi:hypothetical protein